MTVYTVLFLFFLDFSSRSHYNFCMDFYKVRKLLPTDGILETEVPASKSLLNRALILAAFGNGKTVLSCGDFADDTLAMLDCLTALGITWSRTPNGLSIEGCNCCIPNQNASLNVRSAGTAARFLTVALAFAGGSYTMTASEQMQKRPMEILSVLESAGVHITYLGEHGHFPFLMQSDGIAECDFTVNTDLSTQYASGLLLASAVSRPIRLHLTGSRTHGSYIEMTLQLLERFGASWTRDGDTIDISPSRQLPARIEIEADLSGACYFYALSLLMHMRVCIPRVHFDTLQGDLAFLRLLEEKGVLLNDTPDGILADGRNIPSFSGFDVNMRDFSDQALTIAALAPFATSESHITGIGHIRRQECDRIHAIVTNLKKLDITAEEEPDGVRIFPGTPTAATLPTFDDHRVAMAFSLVGLKTGNVAIENPLCCKETFANFFEILDQLTK